MALNESGIEDTIVYEKKLVCNDTIFKFDKNGRIKFGLVADTNDDYDDLDDYDSEYDMNGSAQLGDGEVCVAWFPDGVDEVVEKQNVQLAYRPISPNDFVRRIKPGSNDSQTGYCIESLVSADVQIKGKSVVIKNVASSRLHCLMEEGDWILFDSRIGITKEIQLKLLLKTHCGALVEILSSNSDIFKLHDPDTKNRNTIFKENTFYVGQKLVGFINSLKNGRWITPKPSFRSGQKISFVVQSVTLDRVWVKWQINMEKQNFEIDNDNNYLAGDDLQRLKRLEPHNQYHRQIGDMNLLKVTDSDLLNAITKTEWRNQRSTDYKNQEILDGPKANVESVVVELTSICGALECSRKNEEGDDDDGWQTDDDGWQTDDNYSQLSQYPLPGQKKSPFQANKKMKAPTSNLKTNPPNIGEEITVEIILIRSQVTVVWEDGTVESGISPTHLHVIEIEEDEFFPRNFVVVEREKSDFSSGDYGVVQKVNKNDRMAIVKWFRTYMSDTEDISEPQFLNETEVSVYDLKLHRDFYFELYSKVTRFVNFDDKNDKITIGHVTHIDTDGRIKVQWIDGNYSLCWPQDLIIMSESRYSSNSSLNSSIDTENDYSELVILPPPVFDTQFDNLSTKCKDVYKALTSLEASLQHSTINNEKVMEIKNKCSLIDRLMNTSFFDFELNTTNVVKSPTKSLILNSVEASSIENTISKELFEKNHLKTSHQDLDKSHDSGNDSKIDAQNSSSSSSSDSTIKMVDDANILLPFSNETSNLDLLRINLGKALDEIRKRCQFTELKFDFPENLEIVEDKIPNSENATTVTDTANNTTNVTVIHPVSSQFFEVLEFAPTSHKFKSMTFNPLDTQQFHRAVKHDHEILVTSLPPGVWVKVYEDRLDLLSVAIIGPNGTPYEDGIFLFDFQLSQNYPHSPPKCHYVSLCSNRLNPNLYVDGKVCVSLLGTWSGEGSELWGPGCTLLQVIVSIQGLILNSEPFFNEAGFEKRKGTEDGHKDSEMYNEMVVLRLVESMTKLVANPPEVFRDEILKHFRQRGDIMYQRIAGWMDKTSQAEFPLVPSRGFCLKVVDLLAHFRNKLDAINQE